MLQEWICQHPVRSSTRISPWSGQVHCIYTEDLQTSWSILHTPPRLRERCTAAGMCSAKWRQLRSSKSGTLRYRHSSTGCATKTAAKPWKKLNLSGLVVARSWRVYRRWTLQFVSGKWTLSQLIVSVTSVFYWIAHWACISTSPEWHQPVSSFISVGSASLAAYSTWKPGSDLSSLWY